ncbi:ExbD/TolR family protein [Lewinella sp. IMCC34191]|uniref:ExbD/TolR family protein n=1 Tax=Lewinella sp. IMCC34191 TaxID=2259172 RepID=UPI000E235B83|nr:biopolymer transporter ExbD [Lewinella sp. IMCC34191]
MGLKRSNRANAQFNMSSLTDIIFLLLIFFMLTSNFVQIRPFDLPQSDSQTVAPTNIVVELERSGAVRVNSIEVSETVMLHALRDALEEVNDQANATVTIVAERGVPFSRIVPVMNLAAERKARAIIATEPRRG